MSNLNRTLIIFLLPVEESPYFFLKTKANTLGKEEKVMLSNIQGHLKLHELSTLDNS